MNKLRNAGFAATIILLAWSPMVIGPAIGAMWQWSKTASSNGSADPSVNFREGQPPSSLNDSARALMAVVASYRDDISGALATTGTASAYLVTTNQGLPNPPTDGQLLAVTVNITNGVAPTLSADGGGAFPIQSSPGVAVGAATLISGSPYTVKYSAGSNAWLLRDVVASPSNIPLGGGVDYWGTTLPNSSFAFANGQAISRTTYAALFAIMGTTYGPGDGSTTFNLPDKTGRVTAMKEIFVSRLTAPYFAGTSTAMGAVGGFDHTSNSIAQGNLPNVNLASNAQNVTVFASSTPNVRGTNAGNLLIDLQPTGGGGIISQTYPVGGQTVPLGGSGTALQIGSVPPTIICNYIIRII